VRLADHRSIRRIILALFFLSGACGLVYEVVWMRMLTLVFGATAFATATILASFFAGLALGSLFFGRAADRSPNPLALYAALEAGVGTFAFLMPFLLTGVTAVYVAVARYTHLGFYPLSLLRLLLCFPVLLVPTTLMGGTLPVIVKFFVQQDDRLGLSVGRLYAVNTFGAVLGAIAAGFILILILGVRETAYAAGLMNLVLAAIVFGLSRLPEPEAAIPASQAEPATPASQEGVEVNAIEPAEMQILSHTVARLCLWAIGLSGLVALALEVLWTRALVYFLDNSTHAFTTMLAAFLLGIALGSAVVAWFADKRIPLVTAFGLVEVSIGLSALVAIPILARSTPVLTGLESHALDSTLLWKWSALRFVQSLSVMLVPTLFMGMTVPLAAKLYARELSQLGASLGRVYSVNTIGGVLGSLAAGFVLIPLLGVRNGIVLVAALSTLVGGVLLLSEPLLSGRILVKASTAAVVVLVFAGTAWLGAKRLILASYRERADAETVLSYQEGIGSTVKVFRDKHGEKLLSIDGFPVAGTTRGMVDAQESLGNVPLLLSDVTSPRVNLIGFGAGGASWEALQYLVASVDCVELVPAVIDAAKWFPEVNHRVLSEPKYHLIMGDGRNYAMVTDKRYDVISIDATSPKMAGNGSLYTLEFYRLIKRRLSQDGLVVQWLPFHLLSDAEVKMTARTFMAAFPHTTLWLSPLRYHGLLVGTQKKLEIDVAALREKLERPGVRQELRRVGVLAPLDFLAEFVMGEDDLRHYVAGARLNTDNHPYLEFTPAWSYFFALGYALQNLNNFRLARTSVLPLLVNMGGPQAAAALVDSVGRRYTATQHSLSGDIYFSLGMIDRAREEWATALSIDPSDASAEHSIWRTMRVPQLPQ
jgi:spermidine synthase